MECTLHVHSADDILQKTGGILNAIRGGINCERASFFLVDMTREQLCLVTSNEEVAGMMLPLDQGIAGEVVKQKTPVVVDDAYSDSRFNSSTDVASGFKTRTILAVPVLRGGCVVGVIQALNQCDGGFDESHTQLLEAVALQVSGELLPALLHFAVDPPLPYDQERAKLMQGHILASVELGDEATPRWRKLRSFGSKASPTKYSHHDKADDSKSKWRQLRRNSSFHASLVAPPNLSTMPCISIHELRNNWDLDLLSFERTELLQICMYIFEDSGILSSFSISNEKLFSFIEAIAETYHDNAYHNFAHAVNVLHSSYLHARAGTAEQCRSITNLEVLALFISALGHDADHPGVNNAFLINSGAPLAICYNDKAVLENHHSATTFALLADDELNVFETLELSEKRQLRALIINCILSTDMAHHHDMVHELTELAAQERCDDGEALLEAILHLADLANCVVEWEISKNWAMRVCVESAAQTQKELELGLPPGPIQNIDDFSESDLAKRQLVFLDKWVSPLISAAAMLLPGAKERVQTLEENRNACIALINDG